MAGKRNGRTFSIGRGASLHSCQVIVAIVTTVFCAPRSALASPTIVIDQGSLVGVSSVPGDTQYLGIPFAAPPVGNLRWQPPQPPANFNGVFQTTSFGKHLHSGFRIHLRRQGLPLPQCLRAHHDTTEARLSCDRVDSRGRPHELGRFMDRSDTAGRGGKPNSLHHQLSTWISRFFRPSGDRCAVHLNANYGLMDQQFALKWVRRNIEEFGGNDQRVTIAGEYSGGTSMLANIASPTAAGLFQRGISQNGGAANFQSYWDKLTFVKVKTAESVGTALVPAGLILPLTDHESGSIRRFQVF
jgi:para-nitrobenzyl esterase